MNNEVLIHSRETLKEEFLEPYGLSANQLAIALDVPPKRLTNVINGERGISAEKRSRLLHPA